MHRSKIFYQLLCAPPSAGRRLPVEVVHQNRRAEPAFIGDSSFFCIGVVKKPQVRFRSMDPIWQCTLYVTQFGQVLEAENHELSLSQEQLALVCAGELWYRYCREILRQDSVVHVQARAIQRPRYRAEHGSYQYETELHITPQYGSISVVRQ
jgi:hypothetical protein